MVDRERVIAELEKEGFELTEWTDGAGTSYGEHTHYAREACVLLEGSMTFSNASGEEIELRPGDRLDIAPGDTHAARVGPDGSRYLTGRVRPRD